MNFRYPRGEVGADRQIATPSGLPGPESADRPRLPPLSALLSPRPPQDDSRHSPSHHVSPGGSSLASSISDRRPWSPPSQIAVSTILSPGSELRSSSSASAITSRDTTAMKPPQHSYFLQQSHRSSHSRGSNDALRSPPRTASPFSSRTHQTAPSIAPSDSNWTEHGRERAWGYDDERFTMPTSRSTPSFAPLQSSSPRGPPLSRFNAGETSLPSTAPLSMLSSSSKDIRSSSAQPYTRQRSPSIYGEDQSARLQMLSSRQHEIGTVLHSPSAIRASNSPPLLPPYFSSSSTSAIDPVARRRWSDNERPLSAEREDEILFQKVSVVRK